MSKSTPETYEKKAIKDYLNLIGAFVYHNLAGLGVYPGVPDLTAIYKGNVYQIEVKTDKGKQSSNQKTFQQRWEESGGTYILGGLNDVIDKLNEKRI